MSICIGWMFSIVKYMVDTSKEKIFESKLFLWLKSINGKYALSIFPFLGFYLLTPVLNKTYMLWWLPVFILGVFEIFKSSEWVNSGFKLEMSKRKYLAEIAVALPYLVILSFYAFYFWYLSFWGYGIHVDFKYY